MSFPRTSSFLRRPQPPISGRRNLFFLSESKIRLRLEAVVTDEQKIFKKKTPKKGLGTDVRLL